MKILNIKLVFFCLFSLLCCVEEIDLLLHEDEYSKLVIDGMITNDTTSHKVYLSKTRPYLSEKPAKKVTEANVTIKDNKGNIFKLAEKDSGIYKTNNDVYGVIGKTYTLTIDYDNETYYAESTMKPIPLIDSLVYEYDDSRKQYNIILYGKDPESKNGKYMWNVYVNGKLITKTIDMINFTNDASLKEGYLINRRPYNYNIQKYDTVTIETHSITEDAIIFFEGILSEPTFTGNPFETPPANVQGNISNDAIGLFFTSGITRDTLIIK